MKCYKDATSGWRGLERKGTASWRKLAICRGEQVTLSQTQNPKGYGLMMTSLPGGYTVTTIWRIDVGAWSCQRNFRRHANYLIFGESCLIKLKLGQLSDVLIFRIGQIGSH